MYRKNSTPNSCKSDILDDELKAAIEKDLPVATPHLFISSVTNKGLTELKDLLCKVLNEESRPL